MKTTRRTPAAALLSGLTLALVTAGCESPRPSPPKAQSPPAAQTPSPPAADNVPSGGRDSVGQNLDGLELAEGEASLARNFYFIFDGSGSMKSEPEHPCESGRFGTKVEGAQWAVNTFLDKVSNDVHMGLYVFDQEGTREVVPLAAGKREAFLRAVDEIKPGGGTPLAAAIRFGTQKLVKQYQKQLGYGEYRLVVVTDGQADKIPEAAEFSDDWGMPIYAIGLCIAEDHPLRRHAVSYRAADSFEDLQQGLEETLAELPSFDATAFEGE